MPVPPLLHLPDASAYRAHFVSAYCQAPIITFDGIAVRFRQTQFDHSFFESSRRDGNKDTFSTMRAERIDWILAALQDSSAALHLGWDNNRRRHDSSRRVAVIQTNYVTVIRLMGATTASFVTAYVADSPRTIARIRAGPTWPSA